MATAKADVVAPEVLAALEEARKNTSAPVFGNARILQEEKTTSTEEETQNAGRESVQS